MAERRPITAGRGTRPEGPSPQPSSARRAAPKVTMEPPPRRATKQAITFFSSGSVMLNLPLGGGWASGRVVNVVGDRSAGKTLIAIEACANFAQLYGASRIRYVEAENAFDEEYAAVIGMPDDVPLARDIRTVDDFYNDLEAFLKEMAPAGEPCFYVLDSLDSLSDSAEMEREFGTATYGQDKAKKLSELFRRKIADIEHAKCTLMVISQVRDNIGVTFGEKHKRSGGKALDFYCSQVMWLAEIQKLKRTIRGAERTVGTRVLAKMKKNKVGIPFREAEISIFFSYGIDDETSLINWLVKHKAERRLSRSVDAFKKELASARDQRDRKTVKALHKELSDAAIDHWMDIEADLAPTLSKYGQD